MAHQQSDPPYTYPLGDVDLMTLIQSNARLLYGRHRIYDIVLTRLRLEAYSDRALLIGYSPAYTKTGERGAIEAVESRGTILREAKLNNGDLFRSGPQVNEVSGILLLRLLHELQMELGDVLRHGPEQSAVGHCFEGDAGLKENYDEQSLWRRRDVSGQNT
jgi:hypothetical protein